jgi:pimeloyl-ACP methyl ester carboxylesterase
METVVFLHGLFERPADFARVRALLPERFQTLALELPIASGSGVVNWVDSVDELVEFVRQQLDASGGERFVLVGNSLGGHVAIRIGLAAPERIAGLVLSGSPELFERGFESGVPRRPTRSWVAGKIGEVFHDSAFVTDALIDETHAILLDGRRFLSLVRLAQSAKQENLVDVLPALTIPTLLLWGAEDRITPPETARDFEKLLPRTRLLFLAASGHAPMVENPRMFAFHLSAFLRDLSPETIDLPLESGEEAA